MHPWTFQRTVGKPDSSKLQQYCKWWTNALLLYQLQSIVCRNRIVYNKISFKMIYNYVWIFLLFFIGVSLKWRHLLFISKIYNQTLNFSALYLASRNDFSKHSKTYFLYSTPFKTCVASATHLTFKCFTLRGNVVGIREAKK